MIKAVLFDLDGTLLDRRVSIRHFIARQYDRLTTLQRSVEKAAYVERFLELDASGYVWKDRVYAQLVSEFQLDLSAEYLLEDYLSQFCDSCNPFPYAKALLQHLRTQQFQLGLITNGITRLQREAMAGIGIDQSFDVVLISESEGIKKPHPQLFQRALDRLGVSASEAVYIGDHPINDVEAAEKVGMTGIWKRDSYWGSYEARYAVEGLEEVSSLLEEAGLVIA